jgi:hypothetical protein
MVDGDLCDIMTAGERSRQHNYFEELNIMVQAAHIFPIINHYRYQNTHLVIERDHCDLQLTGESCACPKCRCVDRMPSRNLHRCKNVSGL